MPLEELLLDLHTSFVVGSANEFVTDVQSKGGGGRTQQGAAVGDVPWIVESEFIKIVASRPPADIESPQIARGYI